MGQLNVIYTEKNSLEEFLYCKNWICEISLHHSPFAQEAGSIAGYDINPTSGGYVVYCNTEYLKENKSSVEAFSLLIVRHNIDLDLKAHIRKVIGK